MGYEIELMVGNREVDCGMNDSFWPHSPLFQPCDVQQVAYHYVYDDGQPIVKMKEGYAKPLHQVLRRLELLGYTGDCVRMHFDALATHNSVNEELPNLTFDAFAEAFSLVNVEDVPPSYNDEEDSYLGDFFSREVFDRLCSSGVVDNGKLHHRYSALGALLQQFDPWARLWLLSRNPANLAASVVWRFADVIDSGYADRSLIVQELPTSYKFLIVTEGSSDAKILQKALALLRPNECDFFHFVDMQDNYPFTGAGNLKQFCKGLAKIRILNKVIVIFDNDAEGAANLKETRSLSLPPTMRTMRLPNLSRLKAFSTIGPNGAQIDDINGKAAAIECYLDLDWKVSTSPQVRWTSYNKRLDLYQGELVEKEKFAKLFMDLRSKETGYNFEGLEAILDSLMAQCTVSTANAA